MPRRHKVPDLHLLRYAAEGALADLRTPTWGRTAEQEAMIGMLHPRSVIAMVDEIEHLRARLAETKAASRPRKRAARAEEASPVGTASAPGPVGAFAVQLPPVDPVHLERARELQEGETSSTAAAGHR